MEGYRTLGWIIFLAIYFAACHDFIFNIVFTCIVGNKAKKFKSKKLAIFSIISIVILVVFAIVRFIVLQNFNESDILTVACTYILNIAVLIVFTVLTVKENKKLSVKIS